ncbi:749_t:CDS:2 [Ambispora leptoticha]|uniref:749_t:CDS:1 n=1 Tax=Ambispora leptoticha TaxID=144679 RepID=A0A9N8ZVN1_9GLOM|nr:749_t:CDS:2 [Ambispora leptoticha]
MFQRLILSHSKNTLISPASIFSPRFLHYSQSLSRNEKKGIENETYFETPPKSDTIIPTPLASAFRNMYDDSAIRATTLIKTIKKDGFVTTDNIYLRGPVLLLNGYAFLWDVPQDKERNYPSSPFENWTPECLKIFEVIVPKPEMIIFGTGSTLLPLPHSLRDYIRRLGMQLDMMSTNNAVANFRFLSEEGRRVAAALLPLTPTSARSG